MLFPLNGILTLRESKMKINDQILTFNYAIPNELYNHFYYLENSAEKKLFEHLNPKETNALKLLLSHNYDLFYREGENLTWTTKTRHNIVTKRNTRIFKNLPFPVHT